MKFKIIIIIYHLNYYGKSYTERISVENLMFVFNFVRHMMYLEK